MKKYWIITEFYFPHGNTTSYIMTKIAEGLGRDTDINVITTTPPSESGDKCEKINNVSVCRIKDSKLDKNNLFKRTIKLIILGFRLFLKSSGKIKKGDAVMVVTNPATIIFLISVLKVFKKFHLTILVHDIFPENLVAAGIINSKNIFYKITLMFFNWAYIKADKLIVIGRDMDLFIKNKLGAKCPATVFIPNFADVNEIQPRSKQDNRILMEHGLVDKFIVLFVGNIGRAQDFPNIINTMDLLKKESQIHLLIIGTGASEKKINKMICERSLSNITVLPLMKRELSNDFLNAGDIGLVSLQKNRKGIVSPSKTYSFLAAGLPILAIVDKESEIYQMINESGCGWWSEPEDPVSLSSLIYQISKNESEVKQKRIIARNLAVEKYSLETIIPMFGSAWIKQA